MGRSVGDLMQAPSLSLVLEIEHMENVTNKVVASPALMFATIIKK